MSVEQIRGCGFRKVGACYLVGDYPYHEPCDRMPFPLTVCQVCGQGIKVGLGFTKINPYVLWGVHENCQDAFRPCFLCDPQDQIALIMRVGEKYYKTPYDFLNEASLMGISKRLPSDHFPKELKLGSTVVYLAHPKACAIKVAAAVQQAMSILEGEENQQPKLVETDRVEKKLGIFCAFIPKRVEMLIWQSVATPENLEKLKKRDITPVIVPNKDKDHA